MSNNKNVKIMSDREKLAAMLQYLRIKIADFATKIDASADHLYNLNSGKINEFSQEVRKKILNTYQEINPQWLLTGEGDMLRTGSTAEPRQDNTDAEELAMLRKNNAAHLRHIELLEEKVSNLEMQLQQEREKASSSSELTSAARI